jgi:hypothetical protein
MRYITTVEAEQAQRKGLPLQGGNWLPNGSRKITDGYVMHDTNPKKTVFQRSAKVWSEGKIGRIVDIEPMSTKYAKKHMDYTTIMSQKNRLRKQIVKAQACIAILEDNK